MLPCPLNGEEEPCDRDVGGEILGVFDCENSAIASFPLPPPPPAPPPAVALGVEVEDGKAFSGTANMALASPSPILPLLTDLVCVFDGTDDCPDDVIDGVTPTETPGAPGGRSNGPVEGLVTVTFFEVLGPSIPENGRGGFI